MKKIKAIKNGFLRRNTSLLKRAVKAGISVAPHYNDPQKALESIIGKDVKKFVDDLAVFKGSVTKAGQLLSQYGEYYLSDEINEKLRLLQSSTHFLDFELIKSDIPNKAIEDLDISPEPLAAASIGQVHLATSKENPNKKFVLKIQYKGIEKAIRGDMFFLNTFIKALKVVPKGVNAQPIFNEIESVMRKEMDYKREARVLQTYKEYLSDPFYKVPEVFPLYSNEKVLCMEYFKGRHISDIDQLEVSQQKRNRLGEKILELFFREIFEFYYVQTDAHGGNFLIDDKAEHLYLLDFGACLDFDKEVLRFYQNFIIYAFELNREDFVNEMNSFIEYSRNFLEFDEEIMWEYIQHVSAPLRSEDFDWGTTRLPDELMEIGERLRKTLKFKSVPHQFIFIDRKLMGVFTLLRKLNARFNVHSVVLKILSSR